jgi:putative membrane protein
MANERTFLAWMRTSIAFIAAGVALEAVRLDWSQGVQHAFSALFLPVVRVRRVIVP